MRKISYSYIHTFACPYAAFLRYEGHLRGPVTPPLALGNAVHYALEQGHKETWKLDLVLKLFMKEHARIIDVDNVFITYPQLRKDEGAGKEMLILYDDGLQKGKFEAPVEVEREFEIPFEDEVIIVGKMDKFGPGSVVDYKSGQKKPDPWFLRHNLQFTTYAWAHQEIQGYLPEKLYWHHLRTGELLPTERTQQDVDELKTMLHNALEMNRQDIRYRIYHEQVCNWCPFKGDICDDRHLEQELVEKRDERIKAQAS